jgi:hypothetical protein
LRLQKEKAELDAHLKEEETFERLEQELKLENHILRNDKQRLEMKLKISNFNLDIREKNLDL